MNRILLLTQLLCIAGLANGQNESLIDSLKLNKENKIIVFKTNCVGCIVMNEPCEEYVQKGNPWNQYIVWENSNGYHIRRSNYCGNSDILTIKKWKGNPFEMVSSQFRKIDTTSLKYPLSFNRKDSTWFETGINHYEYYDFEFPTDSIKKKTIKDFAFREIKEDDEILAKINIEFKRNISRYEFNNSTAIKGLLDCLILVLSKNDEKLKITNANNG